MYYFNNILIFSIQSNYNYLYYKCLFIKQKNLVTEKVELKSTPKKEESITTEENYLETKTNAKDYKEKIKQNRLKYLDSQTKSNEILENDNERLKKLQILYNEYNDSI